MDLVTRIQEADQEAVRRAWAQYAALLEQETASAAAEKAMRAAMETLGKTPADLVEDRKVVARVRQLQQVIEAGTNIEEQSAAAQRAVADYAAETEALIRQRRAGHAQLYAAASDWTQKYLRAEEAKHELAGLKARHATLVTPVIGVN